VAIETPIPEWAEDFERRKAAGQIGWQQRLLHDGRSRTWDLTPYNSKSFEDNPDVRPIYNCPTCGGNGCVDENGRKV